MRNKHIIAAVLALMLPATMQAQLKISYFLDRSLQRSALNPAFSPVSNYFSMPVLSGIELGEYGNLALSDFLYPIDGQLYTFLNSRVPTEDVLRNLDSGIQSRTQFNTQILGIGSHLGENLFLSLGVDIRADVNLMLPKELFTALKQGGDAESGAVSFGYKDARADVLTYAQLSAGLKFDMSSFVPGLSVGVKAKYAVIAAAAQAHIDNGSIYLGNDSWKVRTEGTGYYAIQGVQYSAENGFKKVGKLGTAGGGILFDLGFDYVLDLPSDLLSSLGVSASILDFGSLTYKGGAMNPYTISGDVAYNGFPELDLNDNIVNQLSMTAQEVSKFAEIHKSSTKDNLLYKLDPSVYAGAEVSLLKDRISAGMLYSKVNGVKDFTMSANFKLKAFNFAASYSFLTAKSFGCYLGIIPKKGLSIFVGSDFIPTRFTPQFIPVDDLNVNVRTGISFVL